MVLQANGEDPEFFDMPENLVVQVNMTHPEYVLATYKQFIHAKLLIFVTISHDNIDGTYQYIEKT